MRTILVTGGCGYIGSHTIVALQLAGYHVISIDNNSNSDQRILKSITAITGTDIENYTIDLTDYPATRDFFVRHPIDAVIHFAALKAVGESVTNPILYYQNNIFSLINILQCMEEFNVKDIVFSSSAAVYGDNAAVPVKEIEILGRAASPYGHTKQLCEQIIESICAYKPIHAVMLRYFNPVGAHESTLIGEIPFQRPSNILPLLTMFASGKVDSFTVFGNDYPTIDGSGIRDYIHVFDLAEAHVASLAYITDKKPQCEILNVGTGKGTSVFEMIHALEEITHSKLTYSIGARREGDIAISYADTSKIEQTLGWKAKLTIHDMVASAWEWQIKMNTGKTFIV